VLLPSGGVESTRVVSFAATRRTFSKVGTQRTGWLAKCGYDASRQAGKLRRELLTSLAVLDVDAGIMGLTVVGFDRSSGDAKITEKNAEK